MKIFITLILLAYIPLSLAKSSLPNSCSDYTEISKSDFILFNKAEFIDLGECIGRALLQKGKLTFLAEACEEVTEDKLSTFGIVTLSKVEAIQIGQCLGAIAYTHDRYQGKEYSYSNETYHCSQGIEAIKLLSSTTNSLKSSRDVRSVICNRY